MYESTLIVLVFLLLCCHLLIILSGFQYFRLCWTCFTLNSQRYRIQGVCSPPQTSDDIFCSAKIFIVQILHIFRLCKCKKFHLQGDLLTTRGCAAGPFWGLQLSLANPLLKLPCNFGARCIHQREIWHDIGDPFLKWCQNLL